MPEFGDAIARLNPSERLAAVANIELPPEVDKLVEDHDEDEKRAERAADVIDTSDAESAHERIPMLKLINGMNAAQKISLAIKGNKEARTILIRDANKVVAASAIRNPRVTQPEVLSAAQSRQVSDDVIRIITRSKEMTRPYAIKRALVENPKTPIPTAMRFLSLLRESDIRSVAKSRNVPTAISVHAKRLLARKKR